jgi:hypothetical protein
VKLQQHLKHAAGKSRSFLKNGQNLLSQFRAEIKNKGCARHSLGILK